MKKHLKLLMYCLVWMMGVLFLLPQSPGHAQAADFIVKDRYGRILNDVGIILVDWEGHIANPMVDLTVTFPETISSATNVDVTVNSPRIYFSNNTASLGHVWTETSVETEIVFSNTVRGMDMAIFPDRDGLDESYTLTFTYQVPFGTSYQTDIPVHIIDQDQPERPYDFEVTVDFSQDDSGFFTTDANAATHRTIAQQAADDWAYFIGEMNLDQVSAGAEQTFIWNYPNSFHLGGSNGAFVSNASAYTGFLMYVYGIACEIPDPCESELDIRSGGAPSLHAFQTSGGVALDPGLRRSGLIDLETQGNYDLNGWFASTDDDEWYLGMTAGNNDLYSILRHEMGHALGFNAGYPGFVSPLSSAAIQVYHGEALDTDGSDHFPNIVDRISRRGMFGNEYDQDDTHNNNISMAPTRRWLITKLDLLALEAIGYKMRETTPLTEFSFGVPSVIFAKVNEPYSQAFPVGGVPPYFVGIPAGSLPTGLTLDPWTGVLSGTPVELGTWQFNIQICDSDPVTPCYPRNTTMSIVAEETEPPDKPIGPGDSEVPLPEKQTYPVRPPFRWGQTEEEAGASWYNIVIARDGTTIFDKWLQVGVDIQCAGGTCQWYPTKEQFPGGFFNGDHRWKYAWWNGSEVLGFKFAESFFIVDLPLPELPQPFTATENQGRPSLEVINDEGAGWYRVYLGNETYTHLQWYNKEDMPCDNDTCIIHLDAYPGNGSYDAWVQVWGPAGFNQNNISAWSGAEAVNINFSAPGLIQPLTATASISGGVFTWQGAPGATWYQVWIGRADYSETVHFSWHSALDRGCEQPEICLLSLPYPEPTGDILFRAGTDYTWFVRAWGPGGFTSGGQFSGWAKGQQFRPGQ